LKTADIEVKLLNFMGDDLDVANVARVSFDKQSKCDQLGNLQEKDAKLIKYLADHDHWSPFAHCFAQFRIKAPIFVARQLVKHQVGLSWNEVSRRYVDSEPEFYVPVVFRGRAENVKQGSADNLDLGEQTSAYFTALDATADSLSRYEYLLKVGVAPEQARMVLPLNTMTEWIWSGSLMAFARVCKQRLDPHAQQECRDVASLMAMELHELFPVSWNALMVD
jgi:thymidylate synthase (FAD)